MGELQGKIALVTGSTRGLGRTTAEWLAKDGASVIVSGREAEAVEESVRAIKALGVQAWGIPADLARIEDAHRLAEAALALAPQVDILVNNAGMSIRGRFWEVSDADWDYQTNVNYRSPFILAQHMAKQMIERDIRGRIVNFSTIGARACHTNALVYDSAKGAVETMTRNMAYELGPYGITVNCVVPGRDSGPAGRKPELRSEQARLLRATHPDRPGRMRGGHRERRPLLLRPDAGFISGETLLIDGAHSTYLPED